MTPDEVRWWLDDALEAGNRHDLSAVRALLQPDVRRAHLPSGADAWLGDLDELFTAFPDWQWRRIRAIVEGDRVAVHLRARGTHRGPYRGVAATGRRVNVAEHAFCLLRAGRLAEHEGTDLAAEVLRALEG